MAEQAQTTASDILTGVASVLDDINIFHNHILVGVFIRGDFKVLPNGQKFYFTEQRKDEDKWQGKVGLVLKKGPIAFVDDPRNSFNGQNVEPGEWVMYRVSDAPALQINGVHCRLLEDIHIRGTVKDPETIW